MSNIKFNCPQCGQHLAVDATVAGATVACPQCGQTILVPQLARMAAIPVVAKPQSKSALWIFTSAGVVVLVAVVAGFFTWNHHRPANLSVGAQANSRTNEVDWFVELDGINGYYASPGVPQAATDALKMAQQENKEINSLSFTPAGDWVLLDNKGIETSSKKVPDYSHINENTKNVAFSPDGPWVILYRGNGFWGPGSDAWVKVKDLKDSGRIVRSVSFGPLDGFVVLYDETGVSYGGVPADLAVVLDNAASNNIALQCVAFSGTNWICLGQDDWWASNTNLPAAKIIDQKFRLGLHPKWIAFVPNRGPFTIQDTIAARVKARRINALNEALHDFQTNNDQGSATLVSGILDSLDQPGGTSPDALAIDLDRMKNRVRELVRSGAMENAAILNHAQILVFSSSDFPSQPPNPNHKTGGIPGPGGLVLYLPFDKPDENGIVHDESGAGNDGQVFGAQWVPDGKFGGSYRFCVTNFTDRIVISNSDSLNADNITLAAWIKAMPNAGMWERIMDKDFAHGFALSLSGARRGKLAWETGNGSLYSGSSADDNQWHHVAATYDGQTVRCYVDGVESGARRARSPGPFKKCGWDLCIGNSVVDYGWGELMAFDGLIDEVRIYNRALSAEEIKTLATATNAGVDVIGVPAETEPKADTAGRLRKVKELYDQGLITKEQYDQKVKEIMDSM